MSRKKPTTTALVDETAAFARRLLKRASETTVHSQAEGEEPATPAVDLDSQTAVLAVVTRWVAIQHRIAPDKDDDSEFERLRGRLGVGPKRAKNLRGAGGEAVKAKTHNGNRGADAEYDADLRRSASDDET